MSAAVIGVLGTLAGAIVGLAGALKVNADQRREAARTEKRRVFAAYLGALYPAVAELREMPSLSRWSLLVERLSDLAFGRAGNFVRTRERLAAMGNQHVERADRLAAAVAQVQVFDMPDELIVAFDEANNYIERLARERTPALKSEWPALFERLHSAAALLDSDRKQWRRK